MNNVHTRWPAAPTAREAARAGSGTWRPGLLIAALFAGSTLLTPLYPAYEKAFDFGPLVLTLVYGVYVVGNLVSLLWLGRLSDRLGRRPIAVASLAIAAASTLMFLFARSAWMLGAGRVLAGLGVGLGSGAGAAWVAELVAGADRRKAALVTTTVNFVGLAGGAAIAGLLAQFAPAPLQLVFVAYLAVLAVTTWAVWRGPETVRRGGRLEAAVLKPRLGVPRALRSAFVTPAVALFVTMAMVGFYASLAPGVTAKILHGQSPAIAGGVVAEFCIVTSLAIPLSQKLSGRTAVLAGLALLPPGLLLTAAAGPLQSLAVQFAGAAVGGAAAALAYRGSLQAINAIAPQDRRAELVSAYLACGFMGNALPVIGVGALTGVVGAEAAAWSFAGCLSALAIAALAWGWTRKPAAQA